MASRAVTLDLPETLYDRLRNRAEGTQRSIETEALEALVAGVEELDDLPAEFAETIASLALLDDLELWRAARCRVSTDVAARVEELHISRQERGLTEPEAQVLHGLLRRVERTMLIRAHAAALLKQRGYDVAVLRLGE